MVYECVQGTLARNVWRNVCDTKPSTSAFSPRTVTWQAIFSLRRTLHWRMVMRALEKTGCCSVSCSYASYKQKNKWQSSCQGANQKNSIYRNKKDYIHSYIYIKGHNMNQRYRRLSDKFLVTCESNPSQPEISRTFAARVKRSPLSPTLMFNTSFSTRIWRIGFLRLHKMIMLVLVIYEQWEPR